MSGNIVAKAALDVIFVVLLMVDAVFDLKRRVLPDKVFWLILLTALLRHPLTEKATVISCAFGALIMGLPLFLCGLTKPGSFGGGDIKLALAGGWMLGAVRSLRGLAAAFLSAGALMLYLKAIRKMPSKEKGFPFGPFLALGLMLGYFGS